MKNKLKYAAAFAGLLGFQALNLQAVGVIAPTCVGSVILTMDEVPFQPVNGLTFKGVTFGFTIGGVPSNDANINAGNGGQGVFVQDPSLEGNANGVLTLNFATPVSNLRFGVARSNITPLTPGVQVQLFDANGNSIGTFPLNLNPLLFFDEGLFVAPPGLVVSRAVLTFPNSVPLERFAIDNVTFCPSDVFSVRYATNLNIGDSVVDITNTGASSGSVVTRNGNLCANVYVFSPDEQLIECCACPITPNGLASLSAVRDLISNTLTPSRPNSIVIKLVSTAGPAANSTCNAATVGSAGNALTPGVAAWGTTLHALPNAGAGPTTYGVTETPFTRATLSAAELSRISTLCGFNQTNGSTFGVCASCRPGGLGAAAQQ